MSSSRVFKPLRRHVKSKPPKRKITIYSEGEKTEKDYFEAIKKHFHETVVDIDFVEGAGVPFTIAKKAARAAKSARLQNRRQSYATRDEFWALFDRDTHPHIPEALSLCRDAGIGVAFSNPCFELWLILHFEDYDRPGNHHEIQQKFEGICADYDRIKRKTTDCGKLMERVIAAEARAKRQLQRREEEEGGATLSPPFTTVHELTKRIRDG